MYKILIVDDEKIAREGLLNSINWESLGITEIEQAEDGREAIKKALEFMPDIILSDVRMPNMDGIEFIKTIRNQLPFSQIIFISGYSEKDYLKAAIRLEAIEFLEKPYERQDMLTALNKALQRIENYKIDEKQKSNYGIYLREQKKRDIERLARELVDAQNYDGITNLIKIEEIGFKLKADAYYVSAVIKLNFSYLTDSIWREDIREKSMQILWDEVSKFNEQIIYGYYDYEIIAIHCYLSQKSNFELFSGFMQSVYLKINELYSKEALFSIGIGEIVTGINNIQISYDTAVKASNMQYFHDENKIFIWEGFNKNKSFHLSESWSKKISITIETGNETEILQLIESLTDEIYECEQSSIKYIKNIYFNILIKLFNKHSINIMSDEQEYERDIFWEGGLKIHNLKGLKSFIINEIKVLNQYENNNSHFDNNDVVSKIKNYINENYMNDLTIKDIAEYVYLTHTYICLLFKRDTGMTINNYITDCRIKKAIELLGVRKYSLYQVAEKSGFNEYKYFSKVFKKITGISPLEYRERGRYQ